MEAVIIKWTKTFLSAFWLLCAAMCSNWYGMKSWVQNLHPLCPKLYIPCQHLHRMSIHTSHPSNVPHTHTKNCRTTICQYTWETNPRKYPYHDGQQNMQEYMNIRSWHRFQKLLWEDICYSNAIAMESILYFPKSHCFFNISMTDKIQCPVTYHLLLPFQNIS